MIGGVALMPGSFFFFNDNFDPFLVTAGGASAPGMSCEGDVDVDVVVESQPTAIKVIKSNAGKLAVFLMSHKIGTRRFVPDARHFTEQKRIGEPIGNLRNAMGPFRAEHAVARPFIASAWVYDARGQELGHYRGQIEPPASLPSEFFAWPVLGLTRP